MDISQKAKAFEEALERAKKLKETCDNTTVVGWCEYIFPELGESEDEKIRKDIISFLRSKNGYMNPDEDWDFHNRWLPWLEKQGSITKLSEEEENKLAKGVLISCATSFINYLDAHKYDGKMCVSNGECEDIENAFTNAMWDRLHRYYCKYIEKQGEQKPVDINTSLINKMVNDYKNTDEYVDGDYKGKPINCMVRDYRQGMKYILSISKENPIKPAWSEEDEENLQNCLGAIGAADYYTWEDKQEMEAWLESLKTRLIGQRT